MDDWFTLERIDEDTDILSEYRHWEETHCYLLRGRERSLLIDTGLGICDIRQAVDRLTDRPVAAVATHIHWDHIGGPPVLSGVLRPRGRAELAVGRVPAVRGGRPGHGGGPLLPAGRL